MPPGRRLSISRTQHAPRGSIVTLLAQPVIDSKLHVPDDNALAAFRLAFAEAAARAPLCLGRGHGHGL